jgi:hypothetical protein
MRLILLFSLIFTTNIALAKNSRSLQGYFKGSAALVQMDKALVWSWVPDQMKPLVKMNDRGEASNLHPVVILAGEQHLVGVTLGGRVRHPRALEFYHEAIVLIPFLQLRGLQNPQEKDNLYVFSKLYVDSQRVIKLSRMNNESPKIFAKIVSRPGLFEAKSGTNILVIKDSNVSPVVWDEPIDRFVREIFAQKKIESNGGTIELFSLDFLKNAARLQLFTPEVVIDEHAVSGIWQGQLIGFKFEGAWEKN